MILCSRSRGAPGPVRYENWCVDRPSRAVAILVLPAASESCPKRVKHTIMPRWQAAAVLSCLCWLSR